jgi:hypothetical protein
MSSSTPAKDAVPSVTSGSSSDKALRRARGLLSKVLSINKKGKNRASISSVTQIVGKKEEYVSTCAMLHRLDY